MSEKFGLDWQEKDATRMIMFVEILKQELKPQNKEEPKFRPNFKR